MSWVFFLIVVFDLTVGQGITEDGMNYYQLIPGGLTILPREPPNLTYNNGPIITRPVVIQVLFGPSRNNSYISGIFDGSMEQWYSNLLQSTYIDWLGAQYGPISRGSFLSPRVEITPQTNILFPLLGRVYSNSQIQAELTRQFQNRGLPEPAPGVIYMIHFPANVDVTNGFDLTGGVVLETCTNMCAFHSSFVYNNVIVAYGVIPDLTHGGCQTGCGPANSTYFHKTQIITSHELLEIITDTCILQAIATGIPLIDRLFTQKVGWYDFNNGEIADICVNQWGIINSNGESLYVQKGWSNLDRKCIISMDYRLTVVPTSISLARNGSSQNVRVVVQQLGGSNQSVSLNVTQKPVGVATRFSPFPKGNGFSTLTLHATSVTPLGNTNILITARGVIYSRKISLSVTIT